LAVQNYKGALLLSVNGKSRPIRGRLSPTFMRKIFLFDIQLDHPAVVTALNVDEIHSAGQIT
jgi:hypothetical protein